MFTIHQGDPSKINSTRVLDPATVTTLEMVARTGRYPGKAFLLAQGDVTIPFQTSIEESLFHEETGEEYYLSRFDGFGSSLYAQALRNVSAFNFRNEMGTEEVEDVGSRSAAHFRHALQWIQRRALLLSGGS